MLYYIGLVVLSSYGAVMPGMEIWWFCEVTSILDGTGSSLIIRGWSSFLDDKVMDVSIRLAVFEVEFP